MTTWSGIIWLEIACLCAYEGLLEHMQKNSYEIEILINGKPAKEYYHNGKIYIEGRKGTRFSIRLRNNSSFRKLFVPTIDGLSVMNGEEGSYKSSGYIVDGNTSITIDGWRTSNKDVAEFFFSSPENSYRRRMGKGNNLGIIGVAVFSEVLKSWTTTTYAGNASVTNTSYTGAIYPYINYAEPHPMASAFLSCGMNSGSTPTQKLGTGFGETKTSEVINVNFDREATPDTIFELYYNTREELEKTGVNFKKTPLYVVPEAFPGQFCKPPKN